MKGAQYCLLYIVHALLDLKAVYAALQPAPLISGLQNPSWCITNPDSHSEQACKVGLPTVH